MTQRAATTLPPDLEAEYQKTVNDPSTQAFRKATGRTPQKIRAEFVKTHEKCQTNETLVEGWLSLNDEEFAEGILRLSPQGRDALSFLLASSEGPLLQARINTILQQQH